WAAYHYGNWIFAQQYGWVWLPGYEWQPGRVIWSYSYGMVGWMPAPPVGYTYACGYLCPNRYSYYGMNFGYHGNMYARSTPSDDAFNFDDYSDFKNYSNSQDDQYDGDGNYGYDSYRDSSFYYDPYLSNSSY